MASEKQIKSILNEVEAKKELNAQNRIAIENNKKEIDLLKEKKVLNDADKKVRDSKIKELQSQNKEYRKGLDIEARRLKIIQDYNKELSISATTIDDISEFQHSITTAYGKSNALSKVANKNLLIAKVFQSSIVAEIESNNKLTEKQKKKLADVSAAYGNVQTSIIETDKKLATGEITLKQRNELIQEANEKYVEMASAISNMEGISGEVKQQLMASVKQTDDLAKAMKSTAVQTELMERITDELSHDLGGLGPILSSINTLTKTNVRDTLAWKAAVFALGAALGKAAYDYFGAPIKAGMQADKERRQGEIDNIATVAKMRLDAEFIPAQIAQERNEKAIEAQNQVNELTHEAQYAAEKAANSFRVSMQQGAAQFEAASKTALFGQSIGSVSYGAAQMQLAGIGAEKVASAMSAAAGATGKMPTSKIASDMAVLSERTGQSVESVADINEMFQRMDGASEKTALNLQEGLRTMAQQNGLDLGKLMSEVAEASKDALSYQIKGGKALAKQVGFAQSMGVNFGDVAKAGKNMVLNYKDSIKAEMQLSSLLGEQVDLSEVRAKFAAGDQAGALKALQAQGLNPEDMDMFQQEALSNALGGLDLNSLQKIAQNKGKDVGDLKQGNVQKGNQQFLTTTQQAQSTLEAKQANISAASAIVDAKLSQKIADAYLASPEYEDYKRAQSNAAIEAENLSHKMKDAWLQTDAYKKSLADSMQLNFVETIKEGLMGGLAAVGGGLLTTMIDRLVPRGGMGGKVLGSLGLGKIFGGKESAPTATGTMGTGIVPAMNTPTSDAPQSLPLPVPVSIVGGDDIVVGDQASTKGFFEKLKEGIQRKWDGVTGFFGGIRDRIISTWQGVTGFFTGIGDKISSGWQGVTGFFTGIGDKIKNLWSTATTFITDGIRSGWEKVVGFFSGIVETVKTFFKTKVAGIFKKGGVSSMAPGGGEEGDGAGAPGASPVSALTKLDKAKLSGAGKGIGQFIKNVGTGAGKAIKAIMTGLAEGLRVFADPMVVLGAAGLAASIALIGAGIAGAAWIMGKALPTLAEGMMAFNEVDGANLVKVGLGISALGVGMAAMGAGAVLSGVGNLVGKLFGGGIEDTIKKVQTFSNANINAEKVKGNANAIIEYSKAMAASGLGSAASGLGNLVGGIASGISNFFGVKPPIKKMEEFAKLDFGDTGKLKANAEAFTVFGNAMSSYKGSGGMGDVLAAGVAKFFGIKQKLPIEQFKEFATADFGDTKNLENNAKAYTLFGNAMSSYKGSTGGVMEVLAQGVADYFKVDTPIDKFMKFAAISGINVQQVKNNAEAFTAFGNAMATYQGGGNEGFWSGLGKGLLSFFGSGKDDVITKFQRFAALDAAGVIAISNGIGSLNGNLANFKIETANATGSGMSILATSVSDNLTEDRTTLLNSFNAGLSGLNTTLTQTSTIVGAIQSISDAMSGLALSLDSLSSIDTAAINQIPWVKMAVFGKSGGKIELTSAASKNLNLSKEASDNIKKMATNTEAMVKLNNTLVKLTKEGFFGGEASRMSLYIDGKAVNTSLKRYKDNTKGSDTGK
jgi:hypothetical protein